VTLRLGTRLLAYLGVDQFIEDDEMTVEMMQNGKALVTLGNISALHQPNH